jgi:hypothetical protein
MAVSNVAARTLQPALIDIIAKRTIDLYGSDVPRKPTIQTAPRLENGGQSS